MKHFIRNIVRLARSWTIIAPFITFVLAVMLWLVLSLNTAARDRVSDAIISAPRLLTDTQIVSLTFFLLAITALLYFLIDYRQHRRTFKMQGLAKLYTPLHHAHVVNLPKLKYNWRQVLYWPAYGVASVLIITSVFSWQVRPVRAAPFAVTINQKVGTADPNPSYTSVFEVVFPEAIDKATFTDSDITLGGTATGQAVQSITESGSFDGTTFDVRIQADAAGTIIPSIDAGLITAVDNPSDTNLASVSTDNQVTYDGTWAPNEFVTTWKTDNIGFTPSNQIGIPTEGAGYNYAVDWGDGNATVGHTGNAYHTYASAGTYTVKITGDFPRIYFGDGNPSNDRDKILTVEQWGDIEWSSAAFAFVGANNLQIPATDAPDFSNVSDMEGMFRGATSFNSNINHWDVGSVLNMAFVFYDTHVFDQPLEGWNVSNVTNMGSMFSYTQSFNQPLDNWNVGSVTTMRNMFYEATSFNGAISSWNVIGVTIMRNMFKYASTFNQPIGDWDVDNVTDMEGMFAYASAFNQPIGDWDVDNVTDMEGMFFRAAAFDQFIGDWDVDNVTDMGGIFGFASSFNQPLDGWNVSGITNMQSMFVGASSFNQSLAGWNVSNVTTMQAMFAGAANFNQSLAAWNVSNVTDMSMMFLSTALDSGDPAVGVLQAGGLSATNYDATLTSWANQGLNSSVTFDAGTSQYCASVDDRQAIISNFNWTINDSGENCDEEAPDFTNAFITTWKTDNPGVSDSDQIIIPTVFGYTYNYSVDWGDGDVSSGYTGDATHTYSTSGIYTVKITGDFPTIRFSGDTDSEKILTVEQWGDIEWESMEIAFAGAVNLQIPATDAPDLSNVIGMNGMFEGATAFNSNINHWDVSNVTSMRRLFMDASSFNQPLDEWDVSSVTDMEWMFRRATSFNQPLNSWETLNVTDMNGMFEEATSFNQPLDNWSTANTAYVSYMFHGATSFNSSINNWGVLISNTYNMFREATSFNQPLDKWDVSNVTNMESMFASATSFNQPLDEWDVSNVTNMNAMFGGASSFNQPLSSWEVDGVTDMSVMFAGASSFNQPLSSWEVGNVTGMSMMFLGASSFDQSLAAWDIGNVADMSMMFLSAPMDTGDPIIGILQPNGLSTPNYDDTLISWSAQGLQSSVTFDAGTSTYCTAENERQSMITDFNWTINDSGKDCESVTKFTHTLAPDKLSSTEARMNGLVSGTGVGQFVSAGFEWGTTESYGQEITALSISGNAFAHQASFQCDTQYHYRAFAVDADSSRTYGDNTTFTLPCPNPNPDPDPDPEPQPQPQPTPSIPNPQNPQTPRQSVLPPSPNAPQISLVSPKANEGFNSGSDILAQAAVSSQRPIKEVRFYLNGELITTTLNGSYEYLLKGLKDGQYTLIAVAEDVDGRETATEALTFFVNKVGMSPLGLNQGGMSQPQESSQKVAAHEPLAITILRNLPWILLALLALLYAWQAYRQERQNRLLRSVVDLRRKTKENIDSFLKIISHYFRTPITIISGALDLLPKEGTPPPLARALQSFKDYTESLIQIMSERGSQLKTNLPQDEHIEHAKAAPYSLRKWVALPSLGALLLLTIGLMGMLRLGIWQQNLDRTVFSLSLWLGCSLLTLLFFRLWQRQRQLHASLLATASVVKQELQDKRQFILSTQHTLQNRIAHLSDGDNKFDEQTNRLIESGVQALNKVAASFAAVAQVAESSVRDDHSTDIGAVLAPRLHAIAQQATNRTVAYNVPPRLFSKLTAWEADYIVNALTDNALQFTPEGGSVQVNISQTRNTTIIQVTDTGPGISTDKITELMQPFSKATDIDTFTNEGIGLSLYTVRLIAEKHGGTVTIDSDKDKETKLSVQIPK